VFACIRARWLRPRRAIPTSHQVDGELLNDPALKKPSCDDPQTHPMGADQRPLELAGQ